jgi:hypothetical protein
MFKLADFWDILYISPGLRMMFNYEGRSSSKVSELFSQDWEQIDTCGLV